MKIRLTAARWTPAGAESAHVAGDVVEVGAADAARLIASGLAVDADAPTPAPQEPPPAPTPVVDEPPPQPVPAKPKKVDKIEAWQAYARAVGVSTSGKSKAELIAAVG